MKKTTKKAFLASLIVMVLTCALLAGATYAWFTDTAASQNNKIIAGTLDVDLLKADEEGNYTSTDGKTIVQQTAWRPNQSEVMYLAVESKGDVDLKYQAIVEAEGDLIPAMEYAVIAGAQLPDNAIADVDALAYTDLEDYIILSENNLASSTDYFALVLRMRKNAGNEYFTASMDFDIIVFATQQDEEAGLPVYEHVEADSFTSTLTTLSDGNAPVATLFVDSDIEWVTGASHGSSPFVSNSNNTLQELVLEGNGNTLTVTGAGVGPIRANDSAKLIVKDLTIVDESKSYAENAWEFGYLELGDANTDKLYFENCTFVGAVQITGDAEFVNCSFESQNASEYAAWVNGGNVSFTNCTFTGPRGVKIHEDYSSEVEKVVIEGCLFNTLTKKPGVVFGDILNAGEADGDYVNTTDTEIIITNNTFVNCQIGHHQDASDTEHYGLNYGIDYIVESDTLLDNIKKLYVEDNSVINYSKTTAMSVGSVEDLEVLQTLVATGDTFEGVTINLEADIDLNGEEWTPIGSYSAPFKGVFDGGEHTISNVKVSQTSSNAGLFGRATNATIKNLTVDGAIVSGGSNSGAVVGCSYIGKLENVTVTGLVQVEGIQDVSAVAGNSSYSNLNNITVNVDEGSYVKSVSYNEISFAGGVVGFPGEGNMTISNVTSNIDVIGNGGGVGGIIGLAHYGNKLVNCSSSGDVKIVDCPDHRWGMAIGGIVGAWAYSGKSGVSLTNCHFTGTLSTSCLEEGTYYGDFLNGGLVGASYTSSTPDMTMLSISDDCTSSFVVDYNLKIATTADMLGFANAVNKYGKTFANNTVTLVADIDLSSIENWAPIGQTGGYYAKTYFCGIFDGNGKTISNLTVESPDVSSLSDSGTNYANGLFGFVDAGDATIKNLNVTNANVKGNHWVGVIAGYITGVIDGCTVTASNIVCSHANDEACGDKAGIIVGYVNVNSNVTNNTVIDCTVKAGRDAGAVVGAAKADYVSNNTFTNVTVEALGDCTGANVNAAEIGRVL